MDFEWDDEKNQANLIKHRIAFEEAALIFQGPVLTRIDNRKDYGEVREISIGQIEGQVVAVVVHTYRNGTIRIISARLANRTERERYHDHCKKIAQ
ncbi:BrnT family toxin [Methylomonas koyamae]|uniref:BrnT family toxin n=1 Tax=Methylomonas koyamae TaxID=702114 RepID=UPI0028737ACD|nr:BrnT family toxin [Methylomonas koyamae]WNB74360.1 BrnT family toxin [Methylomonas koyamae]